MIARRETRHVELDGIFHDSPIHYATLSRLEKYASLDSLRNCFFVALYG